MMDGRLPDISKWIVLYPVYINSKKTLAEGRRISVSKACENPTCEVIGECCRYLNLPCAIEADKAYSRDPFTQRGRVRVQLKQEDGTFINPDIPSRKALMLKVAELVPKYIPRARKQDQAGPSSSNASSGKSGKGGRKKK